VSRVDNYTSTVDGAAAFERHHGADYDYDDGRPSAAEAARDDHEQREYDRVNPRCGVSRTWTDAEGVEWRDTCALRRSQHNPDGSGHRPSEWTRRRVDEDPWSRVQPGWTDEPPF
jgi:hypothetical protein